MKLTKAIARKVTGVTHWPTHVLTGQLTGQMTDRPTKLTLQHLTHCTKQLLTENLVVLLITTKFPHC
jgi:hypothetical protein